MGYNMLKNPKSLSVEFLHASAVWHNNIANIQKLLILTT